MDKESDLQKKKLDTAVKFLQNPRVRETPMKQRRAFLEKKGLSKEEIDQAIALSGTASDEHNDPSAVISTQRELATPSLPSPPPLPPTVPWRGYFGAAVIGGGLGYLLVSLIKAYIMPLIFNMKKKDEKLDKLEAAIVETNTSVTGAVGSLQASLESMQEILVQQQKMIKGLSSDVTQTQDKLSGLPVDAYYTNDLKAEIASLKGLLLSRKQFPPAVGMTPQSAGIPAWQRATPSASKSLSFAKGTKGGDDDTPDKDNEDKEHTHMNGDSLKNPEASPISTASSSSNASSPVTVKDNPAHMDKSGLNDAIIVDEGDISADTTLSSLSDLSASASFNEASIAFSSTCIKIPSDVTSGTDESPSTSGEVPEVD